MPSVDAFVREEGEAVIHEVGMRCWCVDDQGHADPNHRDHELGGFLYRNPRRIRGLVTSISRDKHLNETGLFLPGDAIFSPQSNEKISEMDKITFTWPLPHGAGDTLRRSNIEYDNVAYKAVKAIYLEDELGRVYVENTDFMFDSDNRRILWDWTGRSESAVAPEYGVRYVVKYDCYMEWIAFVPPVTRTNAGIDLGDKVILRKKHLVQF